MNKIVILFGVLVALIAVQAAPPPQAAAHDVEDESEDVGLELTGGEFPSIKILMCRSDLRLNLLF